jgi:tRNA A-37 threonylcarbamoyl transferase component Bud32
VAVEIGVFPERYSSARLIGRGGMGEIYVAEDSELGRQVAIKVLDQRFADDEHLRRRFKREALAAARLSGHPHVVTIYDVGEWQGVPFIVMEYLPGGTLGLGDGSRSILFEQSDVITWLAQAAEALDAAHELGIVHRDVKPANLLFDARGNVAIADFGIARAAEDTMGMTAAGTVLGTAGYLAPEQALGQAATPASDRYALGVVAYELLTGGRPFERSSATAEAAAHIHEPIPRASKRGVGLPTSVDRVFERVLAKEPSARYRTATEFIDDLKRALARRDEPTRTHSIVRTPTDRVDAVALAHQRQPSSWWLPFLIAGLLLVLVGGVAAAVFATPDDPRQPAPTKGREAQRVTVTERETKTVSGETVIRTVVMTAQAPPARVRASVALPASIDGAVRLTDQSTFALRRGDWQEAARLARLAYTKLQGTYSSQFRYEAYVSYDLGKALGELGRCDLALRYLAHSEELQGHRSEIDAAQAECQQG